MKFSTLLLLLLAVTNISSQDYSILLMRVADHQNDNQLLDKTPCPLTEFAISGSNFIGDSSSVFFDINMTLRALAKHQSVLLQYRCVLNYQY